MDAHRTELTTRGGVRVIRTATAFDPVELDRIATIVDERRGGVMSSGMEYPGRYSRWVMAYADPCAEITATGALAEGCGRGVTGLSRDRPGEVGASARPWPPPR